MNSPRRSIHRDERGVTLVFVALIMVVLLGAVALSVDFGALYFDRRRMVNASDAAALAAALTYATGDAECGTNDGPAVTQADSLATENTPPAVPDDRPGQSPYLVDCANKTVTVQYYLTHDYFFASAIGFDSTPVVTKATGHWGPVGGAGGVLPFMLSDGQLGTCNIPNPDDTDCYFYVNNGPDGYGDASWALLNVQPVCAQNSFGWDVSVLHCDPRVDDGPTYNCPSWGDSQLVELIENGSGQLSMDPDGHTYVCLVKGQHVPAFRDLQALVGETRLFPVNDPEGQIENGGDLCPPEATDCSVDMWDIIGFVEMEITEVLRGQPGVTWPAQCLSLGPKDSNAWCLHATWLGFSVLPGPVCDECEDTGTYAIGLTG